ncbi:DUF4231 domain-containing protein [Algoriphagus sp. D3-2-R+10]|uniref:DUF4231 domain-containing protein n=1 Tax=Algoriphagus aurantiacus TaxID=3103948 RepID=UPI002B36F698|nr:DUF4231 domain-containing protein [Algoriphagus sp. D3-2-R+10]MEB2778179.1 DUF4231 domain-containing protein [Algoriphagus sp. D3-2-R+10]
MENTELSNTPLLNPRLSEDEKLDQVNMEWERLYKHFKEKAATGKKHFYFYKYVSILLAAVTTIVSSLQSIYLSTFPQWILPVISAGATVAVAFLGASSSQKIWINSRTTGQQLQTEKFFFNQQAGIYRTSQNEESIRLFSERLIQIWNEGHGKWEQTVGND